MKNSLSKFISRLSLQSKCIKYLLFLLCFIAYSFSCQAKVDMRKFMHKGSLPSQNTGLDLYYWKEPKFINFGDYLSLKIAERMTDGRVKEFSKNSSSYEKKLLMIGSIFVFARENDVIWGSGINGKVLSRMNYPFTKLDVRAVRGPLTRKFLMQEMQIPCPEIYGDPALLTPYLFPEFKKKKNPQYEYIIIPHYSEEKYFPKNKYKNVVYSTEPWDQVMDKILDSKFVISSSLHGIIIPEAYGIPARLLRITNNEPMFKFHDYFLGTGRPNFHVARSVDEARKMGGEKPCVCDLKKLYEAFPFEFWPGLEPKKINFQQK